MQEQDDIPGPEGTHVTVGGRRALLAIVLLALAAGALLLGIRYLLL